MRARPADDATAIALAVALHLGLAMLLWLAMRPRDVVQPSPGGMAADVVDVGQLSSAMQRTLRHRPEPAVEPLPQPVDEPEAAPPPSQPEPQAQVVQPADVEQEAVVDAPTPVRATEAKVQDEQHVQKQVDLTATPDEQAQAQQRSKAEKDAQLAEIRRRRAAAAREALAAEQKLAQLTAPRSGSAAEEAAKADAGASGSNDALVGRYIAALQQSIRAKWKRPPGQERVAGMCVLVITQRPGGIVLRAETEEPCAYDEAARRSIEAAALLASPLPYDGFETVYKRELGIRFRDTD